MKNYVATMIYHLETNSYVSVKKKKGPPVVVGRKNFVGGKIEQGETYFDAHVREALEETGIDISNCSKVSSFDVEYDSSRVNFACFLLSSETLPSIPRENDIGEELEWKDVKDMNGVVPNLKWIIPLLLSDDRPIRGVLRACDG